MTRNEDVIVVTAIDERVLMRAIKFKYYEMIEKDYSLKNRDTEKSKLIFWLNEKQNHHLLLSSELKSRIMQFICGFLLYF